MVKDVKVFYKLIRPQGIKEENSAKLGVAVLGKMQLGKGNNGG